MNDTMLDEVNNEPKLTNMELPTIKDEGWGTDTDWNAIAASHQIEKLDSESFEGAVSTTTPQARKKWWKLN